MDIHGTKWSDNDTYNGGPPFFPFNFQPSLKGTPGSDRIWGHEGDDYLYGGDDIDRLFGGEGIDFLYGEDGDDTLYGAEDYDTLYGGDDHDDLYGGEGIDYLYGGEGDDYLYGGEDYDHLWGEGGSDTFHFEINDKDTIGSKKNPDWNAAVDLIDMLFAGSAANYDEHEATDVTSLEKAMDDANDHHAGMTYMFLYNGDTGYLVADLDKNNVFETGVVLEGAGAAANLNWWDIVT